MAEILRDEIDLLRALRLELLRFAYQARERFGAMFAAHQRNGAEGAGMIAALRNLQIAHMRLIAEELADTGMRGDRVIDETALRELGNEVLELGESQKQVDFGDFLLQLVLIALDETPDRDDGFDPLLLEPRGFQHRIDGFLLRRVDETAGVDEDDIGARQVGRHDGAVAHELSYEPLRVHRRLVAAERNDAELHPR
jgi:hypothetical protein